MIHIMKDNEKSAKIENEKERATFRKMSIMMVSFVLLHSVLLHYFSMNASKCCAKKKKCIECSLCKHNCSCYGPPKKKHERDVKVRKDDEIVVATRWSELSRVPVEAQHQDANRSDIDESATESDGDNANNAASDLIRKLNDMFQLDLKPPDLSC